MSGERITRKHVGRRVRVARTISVKLQFAGMILAMANPDHAGNRQFRFAFDDGTTGSLRNGRWRIVEVLD